MPQGMVTTARGEILNIDELKMKATLPIAKEKQPGNKVNKRNVSKRKPLNVRGFQPGAGEASVPALSEEVQATLDAQTKKKSQTIRASYAADGEAKTLADITGIRVDKPSEATKAKVKAALESDQRPAEVATEALSEILSGLDDSNPNAVSEADAEEKKTTRRRTSTKKDS